MKRILIVSIVLAIAVLLMFFAWKQFSDVKEIDNEEPLNETGEELDESETPKWCLDLKDVAERDFYSLFNNQGEFLGTEEHIVNGESIVMCCIEGPAEEDGKKIVAKSCLGENDMYIVLYANGIKRWEQYPGEGEICNRFFDEKGNVQQDDCGSSSGSGCTEDPAICACEEAEGGEQMTASEARDTCFFNLALVNNDSALCERIRSNDWRNQCESFFE